MSRVVFSEDGLLAIRGTTRQDVIQLGRVKQSLAVTFNGEVVAAIRLVQITRIEIFGLRGSDLISVGSPVKVPVLIDGGEGGDTIRGGSGNDTLLGGPGPDVIRGNKGNDLITGDDGEDELFGGKGDDVIAPGADKDKIQGNQGQDTVIGLESNENPKDIEIQQPADFRPPGIPYPIDFRTVPISLGFDRVNNRTIATLQFTLPDSATSLISSQSFEGDQRGIIQIGVVALRDVSSAPGIAPSIITQTFDLGPLTGSSVYSFQLSTAQGPLLGIDIDSSTTRPLSPI